MQTHELVSLSGAVAVVTGGGRGIGQAIVTRLAAMEATVILTGRDEARVQQVARDLEARGHRAEGIGCDVTNLASVEALGDRLRKSYGRVDILVNNAGIGGPSGLLHELAPEDWDAIFHTNLRGVYYMLRSIVPLMIATGAGHNQYLVSGGEEPAASGRRLFRFEMGIERAQLRSRGRTAGAEYPGQRDLSRLGGHRLQPPPRR
jgi:NAD(P)-dependent dehydrogenase (short-subunit alcohol dehydrogenase family)